MRLTLYFLAALLIAACGSDDETDDIVGPDGILQNLKTANIDGSGFPWQGSAIGALKRWDYVGSGLIPVQANGSDLASQAMDQIEEELGFVIFDRTSLDMIDAEQVSRGIIVSEGTAIGPGGSINSSTCGHVSLGIGSTGFPSEFYTSDGEINTVLYVHLSSSQCEASAAIAIHEFGHALGLGGHFDGFGFGDAINGNFWNALVNLYRNEVGTLEADLEIVQVK